MSDGEDESGTGIGKTVGHGAAWGLFTTTVLRLGSLASGIVLARLLTPSDYGVYAVALVALTLLQAFNEIGVSLALVQWQEDVRRIAPTVMTIAVTASTLLYLAAFAAAPTLASAMGSPEAAPVLRLMCLAVVIDGIATVPVGLLNRHFLQARRFVGDLVSFVSSTAITISLAVHGVGAMSFAWGTVVGAGLATVAYTALAPWRVWPGWNREVAPRLLRFGLPLAGASLLVLSVANVDNIVVGAVASPAALGLYLMAFNQSSWPLNVFGEAARRVALAGFSRLVTDPVALSRSFARGLALLMAATVPVCALLSSYADALLGFVYGEPWVAAAQALVLLAPLGLIRVALFVVYDLFVALGRSRVLIGLQALWLVAMIPALTVGTRVAGIRGAALAHLLVAALLVAPAFFLAVARQGVAIGPALRACLRPLLGGVLIVLSALVVREVVGGNLPRLLVGGAVGMVLYLGVTWPMRALLPGRAPATPAPGEGTGDALPVGMSGAVHPVPVSAAPAVAGASRDEAR